MENKVKILIEEQEDNVFVPYCIWNGLVYVLYVLDNINLIEKFNSEFVAVAIETRRGGKIILATNE